MGQYTDFFVASEQDAARYKFIVREDTDESDDFLAGMARVEHKNITGLELGALWAILKEREFSIDSHSMITLPVEEEDGSFTEQIPGELNGLLAAMTPAVINSAARKWAEVEELMHSAEELGDVLSDLMRLANEAAATGKNLYIWCEV